MSLSPDSPDPAAFLGDAHRRLASAMGKVIVGQTNVIEPVIDGAHILECQRMVREVPVADHVLDFVLDLVRRTLPTDKSAPGFVKELVEWGASPRASQCLVLADKVRALLRGPVHVRLEDVEALAAPVLRHRISPKFHAGAQGIGVDNIVARILKSVPRPGDGSLL